MLSKRHKIDVKVFYTWGEAVLKPKFDPGFGEEISWDIPLLEGYDHAFVKNVAKGPGSHHFNGIDNPGLMAQVSDWQPDALLVYGWNFRSHLKIIRSFKSKPVYFRGDSTLLNE